MKKFLALSMAAVMLFSIAACSKEEEGQDAEETTTAAEETTTVAETTEETEPPVVLTTVSLVDEERGYTVNISFPEDAGIVVTEQIEDDNGSPELLIEDGDNQMWFYFEYDVSYSNVAPSEIDPDSDKLITAVNVNGFISNGMIYNTGWYELVDADGNVLPDCLKITNRYYAATSDAMTQGAADYFNNEMFISILESVTFECTATAE